MICDLMPWVKQTPSILKGYHPHPSHSRVPYPVSCILYPMKNHDLVIIVIDDEKQRKKQKKNAILAYSNLQVVLIESLV